MQTLRGGLHCALHPSCSHLWAACRKYRSSPFLLHLSCQCMTVKQQCSMRPVKTCTPIAIRLGWAAGLRDALEKAACLLMPLGEAVFDYASLAFCPAIGLPQYAKFMHAGRPAWEMRLGATTSRDMCTPQPPSPASSRPTTTGRLPCKCVTVTFTAQTVWSPVGVGPVHKAHLRFTLCARWAAASALARLQISASHHDHNLAELAGFLSMPDPGCRHGLFRRLRCSVQGSAADTGRLSTYL